jgi:hypothetical protein
MDKQHITRAFAAALASLLLAAPLAASAQTTALQTPSQEQTNTIKSLTEQFFDDVHYTKLDEFDAITASNFQLTYPNGSTIDAGQLIGRAATRYLEESGYVHETRFGPMTIDGSKITEEVTTSDVADLLGGEATPVAQTEISNRTLTWVQAPNGNWVVESERITSMNQGPYGSRND